MGDGGYDCDFVEAPPKSLECIMCMLPMRDPHVLSCCGLKACESCLVKLKAGKRPCPKCRQKFVSMLEKEVQRAVLNLQVYCRRKKEGCEWQGELRDLETHAQRECGCLMTACRYNCGGRFQRRLLAKHEVEECPRCPPQAKGTNMIRNLECKIAALSAEFENRLAATGKEHERQIAELRKENAALREDLRELRKMIGENSGPIQSQGASSSSPDGPSWSMMPLKGTLSSSYPPCQIVMPYFSQYKKSGGYWSSFPFYSKPGGYKMNLLVAANGLPAVAGTHVSVCVCILKGENDWKLKLPFEGKVAFAVVNWKSNSKHQVQVVTFTNSDARKVSLPSGTPVEGQADASPASHPRTKGITNLLPHSALGYNAAENTQYLHEDRLCFRVLSVSVADEIDNSVSQSLSKSTN